MNRPLIGDVANIEFRGVSAEAADHLRYVLDGNGGRWRSPNTWSYAGYVYLATVQESDHVLCGLEKIARIDTDDADSEILVDLTTSQMNATYPGAW